MAATVETQRVQFTVINGPNLNLLGQREPAIYGSETLHDLEGRVRRHAARLGVGIDTIQTNHEGVIVDTLHEAARRSDGVVLNAGAFTHYSYAIHDAIAAIDIPVVEVHISNIAAREPWRAVSVIEPAAARTICGRGTVGYINAIDHLWALAKHPPLTVNYGAKPHQVIDIRTATAAKGWIVLLHGGFWREIWTREILDPLAVDLAVRGYATANVEYETGPGSFAGSLSDVSAALDWIRANASHLGVPASPMTVVGHSAGGYLTARLAETTPGISAIAAGPVLDLDAVSASRRDDDPVRRYLGATRAEDPRTWARADVGTRFSSPLAVVHGTLDEDVPVAHSIAFAEARPGVKLDVVEGAGHFDVVDPYAHAYSRLLGAIGLPR